MIQKFIYSILAEDSVDDDPVLMLAEVQKSRLQAGREQITDFDGAEYYYKSLKTLLGDTSTNWARNKIYDEEFVRSYDEWLAVEDSLPRIGITLFGSLVEKTNDPLYLSGAIKIEVRTKATSNQALARNIALRVRRFLFFHKNPATDIFGWTNYAKCVYDLGIGTIQLSRPRFEQFRNNQVVQICNCEFCLL